MNPHPKDLVTLRNSYTRRRVIRGILTAPLAAFLVGCGTTQTPTTNNTPQPNPPNPDPKTPTCALTQSDIEGPFYTPNAPSRMVLSGPQTKGSPLVVQGKLLDKATCTQLLAGYIIDVWHADDAGMYDNAGFTLRGQLRTDAEGAFRIETILPGRYPDRPYRHIHLKIRRPNGDELLTTQIYFDDDDQLPKDKVTGPIAKMNKHIAQVDLVVDV